MKSRIQSITASENLLIIGDQNSVLKKELIFRSIDSESLILNVDFLEEKKIRRICLGDCDNYSKINRLFFSRPCQQIDLITFHYQSKIQEDYPFGATFWTDNKKSIILINSQGQKVYSEDFNQDQKNVKEWKKEQIVEVAQQKIPPEILEIIFDEKRKSDQQEEIIVNLSNFFKTVLTDDQETLEQVLTTIKNNSTLVRGELEIISECSIVFCREKSVLLRESLQTIFQNQRNISLETEERETQVLFSCYHVNLFN